MMLELVDRHQDEYNEDVYVGPTIRCSSPIPLVVDFHEWLKKKVRETRTYTMYPKKAARQIPVLEGTASDKPHGRFRIVKSACDDVILRRVRR
jgi:hypothetical protein